MGMTHIISEMSTFFTNCAFSITSTTSSINIEYENARKSVDKILNDIDNAKDHIKKLEAFDCKEKS